MHHKNYLNITLLFSRCLLLCLSFIEVPELFTLLVLGAVVEVVVLSPILVLVLLDPLLHASLIHLLLWIKLYKTDESPGGDVLLPLEFFEVWN